MLCFRKKHFWGPSQTEGKTTTTTSGTRSLSLIPSGDGNTKVTTILETMTTTTTSGGVAGDSSHLNVAHQQPLSSHSSHSISNLNLNFKSGLTSLGFFGRGNKSETTKTTTTTTTMAPPPSSIAPAVHPVLREVTEDTPPDLLEGTMDLLVVLPSKKTVRMTVSRRTPMMDLLIQAATSNKIVPGGHIVQVRNERGFELPYKPSTPIGALDTTTIEIVPKNQVNEYIIVKKQTAKIANQPFEHTFRLQVHLPRNQLYVMRAGPKTLLSDILQEVCQEKNLDYAKYEMRHPVKLDEKLPLDRRLGDFGLQEVTVVSRNSRINSSVSTADIMALQNQNEASRSKGGLDSAFKHSRSSVGDSSVSSESAASARGISPSRSDDSRSISPLPPIRPKLKLNTTMSNASSSSGTSSALPKSTLQNSTIIPNNNNNYPNSVSRTSTSLTNNIIQAPPRTKKRAAPQPPTATPTLVPNSNNSNHHTHSSNNNMNHNVNVQTKNGVNVSLPPQSPLNNNANSNGTNNDQTTVVTTVAPTPPIRPTPRKKDPPKEPPGIAVAVPVPKIITTTSSNTTTTLPPPAIHHSRQSSDSSGYHEACVMCDNQETHVHHQSHRFDRQQSVPSIINSLHSSNQRMTSSVSVSNLTTVPSISSTSLASSNGGIRNKRKAPKPPVAPICILQAQKEIDEDISASLTKTSSSSFTNFSTSSTSTSTARVSRSNSESSSSIISQADPQPNSAPAPLQKITATSTNNKSEVPPPLTTTATTTTTTSSKYRYRQLSVEEVEVEVEVHEESPVRRISVDLSEEQDEDNIIATSLPGSFDSTVSSNSSPTSELSHASTTSSPLPTQSATLIVDEGQNQTQVQSQKQDKTENKNNEAASPNKAEVAVPVPASVLNLEPEPATTNIKENAETIESSQVGLHTDYASVEVSLSEPQTSNNTIPSIDVPVEKMSRPVSTSPVAPPSVEDRNKALPNAQADLNSSAQAPEPPRPRRPRSTAATPVISSPQDPPPPTASTLSESGPPKPKPRPRSTGPPVNSRSVPTPNSGTGPTLPNNKNAPESAPVPVTVVGSPNRITGMGIKVFPDDALSARIARLSQQEREELHESLPQKSKTELELAHQKSLERASPVRRSRSKARAPVPTTTTLNAPSPRSTTAPSGGFLTTDSPKTKSAHKNYSATSKNTSGTINPIQDWNQQNLLERDRRGDELQSADSGTSSDSDNLEENLELFELGRKPRKRMAPPVPSNVSVNTTPSTKSNNNTNIITQSTGAGTGTGPVPVPNTITRRSNGPIKSAEDVYENEAITSPSHIGMMGMSSKSKNKNEDNVFLSRTSSDRRHFTKNPSETSKSLNRWQNFESLDNIEKPRQQQEMQTPKLNHRLIKVTNSNESTASSSSSGSGDGGELSLTTINTARKKISVPSDLLLTSNDLDNNTGDHREIQDDTVLPSSESEISYADSGVPATETITPSPIDADLGRSDKGISSGGSSRRSSVHSIDGTDNETKDNLRKILRAKIQKEQEIIDKAFEGIETAADAAPDSQHHDDDDDEDGLTLDSQRQNSNHNSNFDFAQPASMANLLSTSATSSPHPATDQTSDDDEREDDDEGDTSSNDDEEKELKFSSGDDSTTLAAHHTSLEKSSITGNVSNNSGSGSRKTGLGKSESFSHKSEFDAVKMKRRMFSKEGKGNAVVRKSYVSSSDEDLAHAARGGKIIGRGGGGSMQNLSSVPNNNNSHNKNGGNNNSMNNNSKNLGHGSAVNVSSVNSNRRKSAPPTKAASVVNMQEIDPDIAQNPALMESFKNELEAQFEQWKEQFMQKHLGSSKSGSLDNGSSSTSDSRKSSTVDQVDGTVLRSTSSDTPNKSPVEIEDTTDKKNDKSVDLKTIDSSSETSTATIIGGADDADETSRVITTTVSGTSSLTTSVKKSEEKIQKTVYVEKSLEVSQDTKESRSVENLSKGTNENAQNRNDEHQIDDSFDPEKPQIIHSVKSTSQTSTITTTTATNQEEETYCEPEIISQTQVFTETVAVPAKADSPTPTIVQATPKEESSLDEETSMPASKVFESQSEEMEPPVQRREKPVEEQPRIYRYTGPPTISMGTWGERPQRSVSVKRDRDYIMGMGTHDPKTTEVKPAIGSVATRIHSFLGNPVVTPVPSNHVVNSARPKSFYGVVVEASAAHNNNINNHYSNSANTSSSNSASNSNNSTMDRKVVASWKQRLEETEKERRSFQIKTPQSSIDIFEPQKEESRTSTQEPPSAPIVVSTKSNFNGNSNERPVVKKLIPSVSVESISSQNQHNQSSPPPLKISTSTYGETRKIHPLTNSFDGRDIILNSNSSLNNSISNKAMSEDITDSASDYSGSSNSRPTSSLSRAPSNASNNSNIVIASMTSSDTTTNSSFPVPASVSAPTPVSGLAEKKKFFQGIKPAESSAKETPIPAQNLKSNIATIQKVFQQRQQQQQQQQLPGQYQHQPSSLKFSGHGSSTGSSSPWTSKESSPAPSLVFSNNINNGSVGTNSSAKNSTSFSGPSSSTMMVQKVMKAGSFDVEAFRRTPSPSTSSLSSMSTSSKSEDRETPSPVALNNTAEAPAPSRATTTTTTPSTNRFSIGSFEKRSQPQPVSVSDPIPVAAEDKKMGSNNGTTIKNMGNKSIIIVGNSNEGTTVSGNTSVSNNIFRQQLKVSTPVPAPTSQIQTTRNPALKVNLNGAYTSNQNQSQSQNQRSLTSTPAGVITIQSSQQSPPDIPVTTNKVSSIAANLKSNNSGFFSSLQRQAPRANSVDAPTPKTVEIQSQQQQAKNVRENDKPVIIEQLEKNRKISSNNSAPFNVNKLAGNSYGNFSQINNNHNSNNVAKVEITRKMSSPSINTAVTTASTATGPAPPPPPPMINIKDGVKLRTVSLGGERPKSLSMSSSSLSNNSRNNSVTSPTSPNGNADPRSNIMEAIKNSNGKFGLKKTGSSILLN